MIGVFVRNLEGDVGFARPDGTYPDIARFHYAPLTKIMTVTTIDGHEETFTSEMTPDLHEALQSADQIIVAHIGNEGDPVQEYWAELTRE